MTSPIPDPDQFPAEFSAGEKATLTALKAWQEEAREVADAKHAENVARWETLDREIKSVTASMKAAYPDGDADGHRRFHEAMIKKAEERAALFADLRRELAKKGLWAVIALLAVAVWTYFKSKVVL